MIKVCVIGVYFGTLPNYFPLWIKSCEKNNTVDFIIVTDNNMDDLLPANVSVVSMSLQDMRILAEEKLQMEIALYTPFKCCDFKPVYGKIFEDYIRQYDYWGHCDFDLLFGDLRYFFDKYSLSEFDKFLPLGHLAFYKNTDECNDRYRIEPRKGNSYKTSFTTQGTTQFDELAGINAIYHENGFPFFRERVFVDVSRKWKRIKCAEDYVDPFDKNNNSYDKNYRYQLFAWNDGKIIRYFYQHGELRSEEFMYIHLKKRKFENIDDDLLSSDFFCISPNRFVAFSGDEQISKKKIQELNPNYGCIYEKIEGIFLKRLLSRIKRILNKTCGK